jgi:HK97 gp10 family phage protein
MPVQGFRIDWQADRILEKISKITEGVSRKGAVIIAKETRQRIPWDTGELATQVEVKKSKFKDGGFYVIVQGPGNYDQYYASFVELGTYKDAAQPFLRPTMHKNKRKIQKMFQDALK